MESPCNRSKEITTEDLINEIEKKKDIDKYYNNSQWEVEGQIVYVIKISSVINIPYLPL